MLETMRVNIAVFMVPNPMIVVGVLIIVVEVFVLVMGVFMNLVGVIVMGVLKNLFDLAGMFEHVITFLCKIILIVRSIVRSPGVDVEFDAGNSSASLALKM